MIGREVLARDRIGDHLAGRRLELDVAVLAAEDRDR
jgi:hypothetical protein